MIIKTAFRSLLSHRNKTILLMIIISFGAFLTMVGLSAMYTFGNNLRTGLTETMSGDIVVYSANETGTVDIAMPIQQINTMNNYDVAMEVINENPHVELATPISKEIGLIQNPETQELDSGLPLVGADVDDFMKIFKQTKIMVKAEDIDGEHVALIRRSFLNNKAEDALEDEDYIGELTYSDKEYFFYKDLTPDFQVDRFGDQSESDRKAYIESLTKEKMRELVKEDFLYYYKTATDENGEKIYDRIELVDDIEYVEGELVPEGEPGIIINPKFVRILPRSQKKRFTVGKNLKITAFTKSRSIKILNTKIYALVDVEGTDFAMVNNVLDFETFQRLTGYDAKSKLLTLEEKAVIERNKEFIKNAESTGDESPTDDIDETETNDDWSDDDGWSDSESGWGDDDGWEDTSSWDSEVSGDVKIITDIEKAEDTGESIIDKERTATYDPEDLKNLGVGETDFIIIRLDNPALIRNVTMQLNESFQEKKLPFKAVTYIESSGNVGAFSALIGTVITIVIVIIQIISIIIIANSVLMGVLERVNEIGTMRAIGAQRNYIFRLIFSESFLLASFSFLIGTALSMVLILVLGNVGIKAQNVIAGLLFGGRYLFPITNVFNVIATFIIVMLSTFLATIYPLRIATKVSPLEAMNKI